MGQRMLRSSAAYRKLIDRAGTFRIAHAIAGIEHARLLGFESMPSEGDEILPSIIGPATNFNANGREVTRTDLPKETKERMIWTSWKDWHGQIHHGMQFREYQAYPRDLIPPPAEHVAIHARGDALIAASRELSRETPDEEVVNILNVFLEIFGDLEIVGSDFEPTTQLSRVNWKILPPGSYPFDRARAALDEYLSGLPDTDRETAIERIRGITRYQPDFIAVGIGGFSDYVIFGFTSARRYVFESPHLGNATYIFRDEWETVSTFSKREIIQGNLQEARLIHNSRWSRALGDALRSQ